MRFQLDTRLTVSVLLFFLFFGFFSFFVFPVNSQEQITEIYSPSSTNTIVSGWNYPSRAYSSDDNRTYTSSDDAEQEYGYAINIPSNAIIEKVYVGIEAYTTSIGGEDLYVKIYDGSSWYQKQASDYSDETMIWMDFTDSTNWTPEKVNQIKTRILYDYVGGSGEVCYPDNTFILCILNETHFILKRPSEIQAGVDYVLTYDPVFGFNKSRVFEVEVHNGTFPMRKITIDKQAELLNWKYSFNEFIYLTSNHPIYSPKYGMRVPASNLTIGDPLSDLYKGEFKNVTIIDIEDFNYTGSVYNVRVSESAYYFSICFEEFQVELFEAQFGENWRILKHPEGLTLAIKLTYYVDWLPVKIVYTLPSGKQWNTVAFWQFDMAARSWSQVSLWNFSVITKGWRQVSAWMFDLASRSWKAVSVWIGDLACRAWNTVAEWVSSFVGKAWHCVDYWFGELGVEKPFPFVVLVGAVFVVGVGAFIMFRREFI